MKKLVLTMAGVLVSFAMVMGQGKGQTKGNGTGNGNSPFWRLDGNAGTDIAKPHFLGTLDMMGLAFRTNNTEQVRITPDGDVGIGVTMPAAKLHVNGNVQIDMNLDVDGNTQMDGTLDVDGNAQMDSDLNVLGNATIGMKTTTNTFRMPTGAVAGYVLLTDANGEGSWTSPDAFAQTLSWDAASNELSISSGNTVDLSSLIQDLSLNTSTNTLDLEESGSVNLDKYDNGWEYGSGSDLYYTGDVAIGANTFASGYALSVDGNIACEEVLVDMSGNWPDYVFMPGYRLIPLDELSRFITTNGHLPGVPSAVEVADEGVELGEMQRVLMEKVEELTLYTIQQQENIEALKKEIEALKAAQQ